VENININPWKRREREREWMEMQFIFLYYHHFTAMNLIFFVRIPSLWTWRERERAALLKGEAGLL
jgi:hypothetical protein